MSSTRRLSERAVLALLRRFGPRASDDFALHALYIAAHAVIERHLDRLAADGVLAVRQGPFKGLGIPRHSAGTALAAKVLGTYEAQLAPWVERMIDGRPATVVNVGCSDGYYLNGFAMRCPGARTIGYDISAKARRDAAEMARINGLTVDIRGEATSATLNADLSAGAILVIDIEGAELALLDPGAIPALRQTTILVETHDLIVPGITKTLVDRFGYSHRVEIVDQRVALPAGLDDLPESLRLALVCEHRSGAQQWALLSPKS